MPQILSAGLWWLIAAAPLVVLGGVGLFAHVPGEWGRAALLAYAAVLLGCLGGMALAGAGEAVWTGRLVAAAAVGIGFLALSLGGPAGHWLAAGGHALVALLALTRLEAGLPWPLSFLAAAACVVAAVRAAPL